MLQNMNPLEGVHSIWLRGALPLPALQAFLHHYGSYNTALSIVLNTPPSNFDYRSITIENGGNRVFLRRLSDGDYETHFIFYKEDTNGAWEILNSLRHSKERSHIGWIALSSRPPFLMEFNPDFLKNDTFRGLVERCLLAASIFQKAKAKKTYPDWIEGYARKAFNRSGQNWLDSAIDRFTNDPYNEEDISFVHDALIAPDVDEELSWDVFETPRIFYRSIDPITDTPEFFRENVFERMLFHTVKVLYPSAEQLKFLSELNKVWKDRILALWFNE